MPSPVRISSTALSVYGKKYPFSIYNTTNKPAFKILCKTFTKEVFEDTLERIVKQTSCLLPNFRNG